MPDILRIESNFKIPTMHEVRIIFSERNFAEKDKDKDEDKDKDKDKV